MKLPLETDELVTGLSVSRSGNRRPGQSKGRALVRFCGWAVYLEPASLHHPAFPEGVPRGGDFSPVHLEQPVSGQEGFR